MAISKNSTPTLLLPLFTVFFFLFFFSFADGDKVHDLLPEFGLPRGLLPNCVESYTFDSTTGHFSVELKSPCYVQFSHLVYYEKTVKGKLSYGKITEVSGVQAKKLFVWVSITGMVAHPDQGVIEFQVGVLSEELPAKQFETVPVCKKKATGKPCRVAAGLIREYIPAVAEV